MTIWFGLTRFADEWIPPNENFIREIQKVRLLCTEDVKKTKMIERLKKLEIVRNITKKNQYFFQMFFF